MFKNLRRGGHKGVLFVLSLVIGLGSSLPALAATPGYFLIAEGDRPSPAIILGNASDEQVSVFHFRTDKDEYVIEELTLVNCVTRQPDWDFDCADAGESDGEDDAVVSVSLVYQNSDGDTVTELSTLSGGEVAFSGLDLYVGSTEAEVVVLVDTNSVSSTGADSGSQFQLNLAANATYDFEAISLDSGMTYDGSDKELYILGSLQEIHKTKPTLSKASGSPSGSAVPGSDEVLRFNVAADAHGYVEVNQLTFKVSSTDISESGWNLCDEWEVADFSLYNYDDLSYELESSDADWAFYDSSGTDCGTGNQVVYATVTLSVPVEVSAGTTETFSLEVDTTGASSAMDDSVRFDIPRQSELDTAGTGVDSINWDDDRVGENFDGSLIKTLPVTGGTLVF